MTVQSIIGYIDLEIGRLRQARALLGGDSVAPVAKRGPGRPKGPAATQPVKRKMSVEGRARISEAMKARWAKKKATSKAKRA
jgi:hypothetical protein